MLSPDERRRVWEASVDQHVRDVFELVTPQQEVMPLIVAFLNCPKRQPGEPIESSDRRFLQSIRVQAE